MKHHYLPIFYTKKWGNKNGKIFYYSIKNNKIICHDITPRNTGYEIDLYAKKIIEEESRHSIETGCYKIIDDKAAKILNRIIANEINILSITEKNDWCRFLVSMMTRHSSIVFDAKARGVDIITSKASDLTTIQQQHHMDDINYWKDHIGLETLVAITTPEHKNGLGMFEKYNEALLKMTWWIEDFSKTSFALLTSDYPLSISPLKPNHRKFSTLTEILLSGDYLLSLPLTPELCFYAATTKIKIISSSNQVIK